MPRRNTRKLQVKLENSLLCLTSQVSTHRQRDICVCGRTRCMQDITEMCDKQSSQPETPSSLAMPSHVLMALKESNKKKRTPNDDNGGNVNINVHITKPFSLSLDLSFLQADTDIGADRGRDRDNMHLVFVFKKKKIEGEKEKKPKRKKAERKKASQE